MPDDDPLLVRAMIQFFYKLDYWLHTQWRDKDDHAKIETHVRMFALGDKYNVSSLKQQAKDLITEWAGKEWSHILPISLRKVYELEGVEELRLLLVRLAWTHLQKLLDDESFEEFMANHGEFGRDLAKLHLAGDQKQHAASKGIIHFHCDPEIDGCELNFMLNLYDYDDLESNANIYLVTEYGTHRCVCPRVGCDRNAPAEGCYTDEKGPFNVEGWYKYICRSKRCEKTIWFRRTGDEILEDKSSGSLEVLCPVCGTWKWMGLHEVWVRQAKVWVLKRWVKFR